ncbi:NAD-dependent epimerase/dehydratase family protein [Blautia producta]|nr:NAD-dependent epimerase/dehydratase family protein [Blautia producta]
MENIKNPILYKDLCDVANSVFLKEIDGGSTILVTGATGMIGFQIIQSIVFHNNICNKNIKIIALARNKKKADDLFKGLVDEGKVDVYICDINEKIEISNQIDYIIHGASATSSRYFVTNPVETILTALHGTKNILEIAKEKNIKKMVYLSSLEVYGTPDEKMDYITEKDYGYLDPMQVRSSYSEGKRMAECLCASYAKEYKVPVLVARLSQTFGAAVSYEDSRVFAEFARCVIEKRNIVLHTAGRTVRSYCYTKDAITAIVCLLTRGKAGEAYNITNMNTAISIKEMAELVSRLSSDHAVKLVYDIPEDVAELGYNPEMIIRLDNTKLKLLGWTPTTDLEEMYVRLIKSMEFDKK